MGKRQVMCATLFCPHAMLGSRDPIITPLLQMRKQFHSDDGPTQLPTARKGWSSGCDHSLLQHKGLGEGKESPAQSLYKEVTGREASS